MNKTKYLLSYTTHPNILPIPLRPSGLASKSAAPSSYPRIPMGQHSARGLRGAEIALSLRAVWEVLIVWEGMWGSDYQVRVWTLSPSKVRQPCTACTEVDLRSLNATIKHATSSQVGAIWKGKRVRVYTKGDLKFICNLID